MMLLINIIFVTEVLMKMLHDFCKIIFWKIIRKSFFLTHTHTSRYRIHTKEFSIKFRHRYSYIVFLKLDLYIFVNLIPKRTSLNQQHASIFEAHFFFLYQPAIVHIERIFHILQTYKRKKNNPYNHYISFNQMNLFSFFDFC